MNYVLVVSTVRSVETFPVGQLRQRAALAVRTGKERHRHEMALPWMFPGD